MLPSRRSTNVTPGYVSPRPTGSSISARRQPSTVTNQEPFRAVTTQTVETESSADETFPQGIPPTLPGNNGPVKKPTRAEEIPQMPLGNNGFRQKPIRRDTPIPTKAKEIPPIPLGKSRSRPIRRGTRIPTQPAPDIPEDSSSPYHEAAAISEGIHAGIWPTYNKVSQEFDEKRFKRWNDDLDVLLIFVSPVVEVFIDPDRADT